MTQSVAVAFGLTARDVVAMGRAPWHGRPESDNDECLIVEAMAAADVTEL